MWCGKAIKCFVGSILIIISEQSLKTFNSYKFAGQKFIGDRDCAKQLPHFIIILVGKNFIPGSRGRLKKTSSAVVSKQAEKSKYRTGDFLLF